MNNNINMSWQEALEIVIDRTKGNGQYGHDKYRDLTHESHPDHLIWRNRIISKVTGIKEEIKIKQSKHISTQKTIISTGNGHITSIASSDAIQLNKEIKECLYFIKDSGCGCQRGRCKIGKGGEIDTRINDGTSLVSFWDCAACLRPGVELYEQNKYRRPE